jgi:hypothetical protein
MRAQFADVATAVSAPLHIEAAGPVQIIPPRLVPTVPVEDLDPVVLAIGDVDPTVRIADIVRYIELPRIAAAFASRVQPLSIRVEFVHPGIGIAV